MDGIPSRPESGRKRHPQESNFAPILPLGRAHRTGKSESPTFTYAPHRRWFKTCDSPDERAAKERKITGAVSELGGRVLPTTLPIAENEPVPAERKRFAYTLEELRLQLQKTRSQAEEIDREYKDAREKYKKSVRLAGGLYSRDVIATRSKYQRVRQERRLIYEKLRALVLKEKRQLTSPH
jgi:hypothetical protein